MAYHRLTPVGSRRRTSAERGLTLVELMVSLAVGLVLVLAAALAYLGTRTTASSMDQVSQLNESGKLALDILAREIQMSCYYPLTFGVDPTSTDIPSCDERNPLANLPSVAGLTPYLPVVAVLPMLFGCDSGIVQHTTRTAVNSTRCNTATAGAAAGGSIVVSYFVWPRETGGTAGASSAAATDCLRQSVTATGGDAAINALADAPLFVSNIFSLRPFSYVNSEGVTVNTNSLACEGNGNISATPSRQPMLQGVEQMVLRYVVIPGYTVSGYAGAAKAFYTAADLNSPGTGQALLDNWRAVVNVRICLVMATTDPVRQAGDSANSYRNCDGTTTAYPTGERRVFKAFERTVAVRNNTRW
jgi:type IV pilus assembly protein PilW